MWYVVLEKPEDVDEDITAVFRFKVQIPKDLTCEHCVFQMWWLGNLNNQLYIRKFIFK